MFDVNVTPFQGLVNNMHCDPGRRYALPWAVEYKPVGLNGLTTYIKHHPPQTQKMCSTTRPRPRDLKPGSRLVFDYGGHEVLVFVLFVPAAAGGDLRLLFSSERT